jgi:hypothetical protein
LPRYRVPILQTGSPNLADGDIEAARDLALEILRAHVTLFDPQEKVIAVAARLVSGDLFDLEVLWHGFDSPADSGQGRREQRGWLKRIE